MLHVSKFHKTTLDTPGHGNKADELHRNDVGSLEDSEITESDQAPDLCSEPQNNDRKITQ